MRLAQAVLLLLLLAAAPGQGPSPVWRTGFWLWGTSYFHPAAFAGPVDSVYVHAGNINERSVHFSLPRELPAAREYWLVFRYDERGVPAVALVPELADQIADAVAAFRRRGLPLAGVQLDIDSPTAALPRYAEFLRALKKQLRTAPALSITALLDWFRPGTAIDDVLRETSEFVPQFYDAGAEPGIAIAEPIDAAKWGPVLNRFRRPFRIGVSTFGRARVSSEKRHYFYRDLTPMHVAVNPAFQLIAGRNDARELVLRYRARRAVRISYNRFEPGDAVEFIVSTPETVRAAVDAARQIGGHCAGVVFFRWPGDGESLALLPSEILGGGAVAADRVHAVDGRCAAVSCNDLYYESARPLAAEPLRRRIVASAAIDYFLPDAGIPIRLAAPDTLELSLPPYCARGRLYLGRAVSAKPVDFRIEETK